jgi:hypothetical protein
MIIKTVLNKEEFNTAIRHYFFRRDIGRRLFLVIVFALILATFNFGEPKFLW